MAVIFLIIGLFIALLGCIVWRFERTDLLSNVDQTRVTDKKGLAGWAGKWLLALSAAAFATGIVSASVTTERGQLITCIAFILSSQLLIVVYLAGLRRYTK
ncbi:hypothetical protein [Spirosoma agri]|uniref:DUF3784 domain-containing protein n=1 Tax=Spirosoma agri TaxID=1987381 RepID=A0A6M0IP82_9BACT|nr:hypothetical protein [Spirosoma agri]NEU69844.1 hypothetical protein [Spirosoma agri]